MPSAIFSHGTVAINCLVEPPANTIQVGFKAMEETSTIIHQSQPPAEGDATTMAGCSFSIGHCIHRTRRGSETQRDLGPMGLETR